MLFRKKQTKKQKRGSKKSVSYIDKMLRNSIMELRFILSTAKLTPQEDKEIRAELMALEEELKHENIIKNLNKPGISTYGSYFTPYTDIKLDSTYK